MRRAWPLAAVIGAGLAVPSPAGAATISMSGSPVTQAVVADLAYFYGRSHPATPRFSLVGGGTSIGIADATRGVVDAGMVSRSLGPSDPPGLVLSPFALSGVCLVTNKANPVPGITRAQIQDIVAGRLTSWTQVPGSSRTDAIVPATLDVTTGERAVFDQVFVDLGTPVAYAPRTYASVVQVREFVEATAAAFGYVDLALTTPLNVLTYNGAPCTRQTISSGAYPARRPLGIVTRGRPRGALARFLRWVRTAPKARQVISSRYIPRF
jgi:phosphate transport system substrate-binding protein